MNDSMAANMPKNFNSIEEAITFFYKADGESHKFAQQWLTELQNSPKIWNVIWTEMLASKDTQVQFYGTTVLHSKLLNSFDELTLEQYDALKKQLLETIYYFRNGPKLVLNRLCKSMATFVLHLLPAYWPNGLQDLIALYKSHGEATNSMELMMWILLEILSSVPEEFARLPLTKNKKLLTLHALENESIPVLSLLEDIIVTPDQDLKTSALSCFKSWLEFGIPLENCENIVKQMMVIISESYNSETSYNYCKPAVDVLKAIVSHKDNHNYPKTFTRLIEMMLPLENLLNVPPDSLQNSHLVPSIYALFISIGERCIRLLIGHVLQEKPEMVTQIFGVILRCSSYPGYYPIDETISLKSINFWYVLEEEVHYAKTATTADPSEILKPLFTSAVQAFIRKSTYPENFDSWSMLDKERFGCYRQDIADTYVYCLLMLQDDLQKFILDGLGVITARIEERTQLWASFEAHLFLCDSVADHLVHDKNDVMAKFMSIAPSLLFVNDKLSRTILHFLGSMSDWFRRYPKSLGEILFTLLNFISVATDTDMLAAATLSLKDILRGCITKLEPFACDIVIGVEEILTKNTSIARREQNRLVFCMGKALCGMEGDAILLHLDQFTRPCILSIHNDLLNSTVNEEDNLVTLLGYFQNLFLSLDLPTTSDANPVQKLLEHLLPTFEAIVLKHHSNDKIIRRLCETLGHAFANDNGRKTELLCRIAKLIIKGYRTTPKTQYIELSKQLALRLISSKDDNVAVAQCSELVREMTSATLDVFSSVPEHELSQFVDIVSEFYDLCYNLVKKAGNVFDDPATVNVVKIFQYACLAIGLQEEEALKYVCLFLSTMINLSRERTTLAPVVEAYGNMLVLRILIALGNSAPRYAIDHLSNILVALNKKYCSSFSSWLRSLLSQENFPSPKVTSSVKEQFINCVIRSKANKRKVVDASTEFYFSCRGIANKDVMDET